MTRRLTRRWVGWALLAETIPIYPLYALLFADSGLSDAQISTLFLVWSVVGIVAEVPTGVLADRFSHRAALAASTAFQAAGYVVWIVAPNYLGFAAGFVLWGLGGSLGSGALEALLYDGLTAAGRSGDYPRVYARVSATRLVSQLPAAALATVLFAVGGYALAGWASVLGCLAASVVAMRLPGGAPDATGEPESSYVATLRAGVVELARHRAVLAAAVAVALVGSLDGLEEYFTLLARQWGVPTVAIPLALLAIPVCGAVGAWLGGRAATLQTPSLGWLLAGAVAVFAVAGALRRPAGIGGIAVAYGLYQVVSVVIDGRLQAAIEGRARATVTSVASLGVDLCTIGLYAAWALGRPGAVAVVAAALGLAAGLPALVRRSYQSDGRSSVFEPK